MSETIYFIQGENSGAIKIGYSSKVGARLAAMRTASAEPLRLLGCAPGGRLLERQLHREFADARSRGEWFCATPELIARISSLCTEADIAREVGAPSDDPHTKLAQRWIGLIEEGAMRQGGCTLAEARTATAKTLGLTPGFLENLRRGRIAAIAARDYEAIRRYAIGSCHDQMAAVRADLSAILEALGRDRKPRERR
jgi:hypothetical protein